MLCFGMEMLGQTQNIYTMPWTRPRLPASWSSEHIVRLALWLGSRMVELVLLSNWRSMPYMVVSHCNENYSVSGSLIHLRRGSYLVTKNQDLSWPSHHLPEQIAQSSRCVDARVLSHLTVRGCRFNHTVLLLERKHVVYVGRSSRKQQHNRFHSLLGGICHI